MDTSRTRVLDTFEGFRVAMDDANDRRERLVKISRDITIYSKRVIFLLHRLVASPPETDHGTTPDIRAREKDAAAQAFVKLEEIKALFNAVADELEGQEIDRFTQAV